MHYIEHHNLILEICGYCNVLVFFCRQYINNEVVQFARDNPGVAVYVRYRPKRHPRLIGEFCKPPPMN